MKTLTLIYTTVSSLDEANQLATAAVESQKAACVNIIPNMLSVYTWNSKLEQSYECGLLFKTTTAHQGPLLQWIKDHHPYEVPALLTMDAATSDEFFAFIAGQVTPI